MTNLTFADFYSTKINSMTLQEALDMHYAINPQFTPWYQFEEPEARNLIKSHDMSHVIYGCDTSFMGESMVQFWNNSSSELNIPMTQAPKYIFNKHLRSLILPTNLFGYFFSHFGAIMKNRQTIKNQSKQMTKKWQYFKEDAYLNTTIGDIRKEYGINIDLPIVY